MALKRITTLIASAALCAATLTATPASAGPDGEKLLKLAIGVGALAVIANGVKNNNDKQAQRAANETRNLTPVYDPYGRYDRYDRADRYGRYDRHDDWRRDDRRHRDRKYDIPKTCLYKHWTPRGWETLVSRSCVNKWAARNHIKRRDILPRYRDDRGRIVWLDRDHGWIN